MKTAAVIDYGVVNIKNVLRSLEYVGVCAKRSEDPDRILNSDAIILPGVGAFASGMSELQKLGMDDAIKNFTRTGRPVLGICLGMQLLLDVSYEFGQHQGLGLIPGSVIPVPTAISKGKKRKVPHIGWNALKYPFGRRNWNDSCLDQTPLGTFCYFVHSYMAIPSNKEHVFSESNYDGVKIVSAIRKDNITGLQFHPERSGPAGLQILRRFAEF